MNTSDEIPEPWSLGKAVMERLGLTPEQEVEFRRRYAEWNKALAPLDAAFRRSEHITAEDLATRVGPCDR